MVEQDLAIMENKYCATTEEDEIFKELGVAKKKQQRLNRYRGNRQYRDDMSNGVNNRARRKHFRDVNKSNRANKSYRKQRQNAQQSNNRSNFNRAHNKNISTGGQKTLSFSRKNRDKIDDVTLHSTQNNYKKNINTGYNKGDQSAQNNYTKNDFDSNKNQHASRDYNKEIYDANVRRQKYLAQKRNGQNDFRKLDYNNDNARAYNRGKYYDNKAGKAHLYNNNYSKYDNYNNKAGKYAAGGNRYGRKSNMANFKAGRMQDAYGQAQSGAGGYKNGGWY